MDFVDDETVQTAPFEPSGSVPIVENGSSTTAALLMDDFTDAPAPAEEGASTPAVEDAADAFFSSYTPTATPAAPAPPPAAVDPRIEWRRQNAEVLKKRDAEEAVAKKQLLEKAQEHLKKYYDVRGTTLAQRKTNNRKAQAVAKEAEVPANGTAWEKVMALVNLGASHQKDLTRYKAVLIAAKAANVPVRAA